jgi:hypothetical protein
MVASIEKRIAAAAQLGPVPDEFADAPAVLAAARDFVASGGLGYVLVSGRRPSAP